MGTIGRFPLRWVSWCTSNSDLIGTSLCSKRLNEKLAPHYSGPFKVVARVGAVACRLLLPADTTIHPIFHASQLRRALGAVVSVSSVPPQLLDDLELQVEPVAIMGIRPSQDP